MTQKTQDPIEKFCTALKEQGWVLYVPENIWKAYQQGLLITPYWTAGPREGLSSLEVFQKGKLTGPTFMMKREWQQIQAHFGHLENLKKLSHPDGSVSRVWLDLISFQTGYMCVPEHEKAIQALCNRIGITRDNLFRCYGEPVTVYGGKVVSQLKYFSSERVRKLRRKLEDHFRKSKPGEIVKAAELAGLIAL